jgi:hypothetical protein
MKLVDMNILSILLSPGPGCHKVPTNAGCRITSVRFGAKAEIWGTTNGSNMVGNVEDMSTSDGGNTN